MSQLQCSGLTLEYDWNTDAGADAPAIVLVHGLGCQLIQWPQALVQQLSAGGFRVLRFDNRDVGLSKLHDAPPPERHSLWDLARWRMGARLPSAYSLSDMAGDVIALLDHLGVQRAHVAGASMGGMITQVLGIEHAARLLSATVIMSTSGKRNVGGARPAVRKALMQRPASQERQAVIDHLSRNWAMLQGRGYQTSDDEIRQQVAACFDRGMNPAGFMRQLQAIFNAPNREPQLRNVTTPTLVLHGADDPLVNVSGGKAIAKAIPNARLELIDGWGHDLPAELLPRIGDLMLEHMRANPAPR